MAVYHMSKENVEKILEALENLAEHDQPAKDLLEKLVARFPLKTHWTIIVSEPV